MTGLAFVVGGLSALVFTGLVLVRDRPTGAFVAQIGSAIAAVVLFAAIVATPGGEVFGVAAVTVIALGAALLSATISGMFYHQFLGRFDSIWRARIVFALVYLGTSAVVGTLLVSLF